MDMETRILFVDKIQQEFAVNVMEKDMSERKLAHIEVIEKLEPIPGADKIEKVTILGWEVVVNKNKFKVGDLVCYIEIDSILPAVPVFEFMEQYKYRVRTIKLRKQISQGLIISLRDTELAFSQRFNCTCGIFASEFKIGHDVTDILGITKHDPQAKVESGLIEQKKHNPVHKFLLRYAWYRSIQPKKHGRWPNWIQKTDEERIQNIPSILRNFANTNVYWTEKLDGQSASYSYKKVKILGLVPKWLFTVCSRNLWLKKQSNKSYWQVAAKYDLKNKLKDYNKELVIQGEICGPGIQKNKYNFEDYRFFVFSIYDIKQDLHLGVEGIRQVCRDLDLEPVPLLSRDILGNIFKDVSTCVDQSKGTSIFADRHREGIVVRQYESSGGKKGLSFKCINPDFLLGIGEDE